MIVENVIIGNQTPRFKKALWIDTADESNPIIKVYLNGGWVMCNQPQTQEDSQEEV